MLSHQLTENKSLRSPAVLMAWAIFILYLIIAGFAITHHELWGDELHSWNISKGSGTFSDLISNTRYEGHPPVWYCILWLASKFTHEVAVIHVIQFIIANLAVFILLFYSPIPLAIKALIPFGYFFLFEYGVLSRNYGIAVLLAFCLCLVLQSDIKKKIAVYYILLFLLSNTHLLGLILAMSFHFYFLLQKAEREKSRKIIVVHFIAGVLILLPALYFIFPPADSGLNTGFWLGKWSPGYLTHQRQPLLNAFIPIPAWWQYHFWNTEFLIELSNSHSLIKWATVVILLVILFITFITIKRNKKALLYFLCNLFLFFAVSIILPFSQPRHAGFIFISFIIALWLYCKENYLNRSNRWLVCGLLIVQMIGGIFSVAQDIRFPFSNAHKINELLKTIPSTKNLVSDYWTVNVVSAYTDKPVYCLEMQREMSFLLWTKELEAMRTKPNTYTSGLVKFFETKQLNQAYFISINPPQLVEMRDSSFFKSFKVELVDKREGAIEKGSNLYLYQIDSVTQ